MGGGDNEGSSVVLGTMGEVERGGGRREYGTAGWEAGTGQDEWERKQAGQEYREGRRVRRKVNEGIKNRRGDLGTDRTCNKRKPTSHSECHLLSSI